MKSIIELMERPGYSMTEDERLEIELLAPLVSGVWCVETAAPNCREKWSPENPAFGQCAVTAALVFDLLGGELIRTEVAGFGSHYFNRLVSGVEIDLTRSQFPVDAVVPPGAERTIEYLLDSPNAQNAKTRERFQKLKDGFFRALLDKTIEDEKNRRRRTP